MSDASETAKREHSHAQSLLITALQQAEIEESPAPILFRVFGGTHFYWRRAPDEIELVCISKELGGEKQFDASMSLLSVAKFVAALFPDDDEATEALVDLLRNLTNQLTDIVSSITRDLVARSLRLMKLREESPEMKVFIETATKAVAVAATVLEAKRQHLRKKLKAEPTKQGRPKGTVKPLSQKERESLEFGTKIEETMRMLLTREGKLPTKTAVAKALGIGGRSPKGSDTHLNAFNNKLARNNVDYDAICERVKRNK